jgi:hypothetical protein
MGFQHDVEATPGLQDACRPGLQAVQAADRRRMTARPPRKLAGSVNLDSQLEDRFRKANRWDYVVAWNAASGDDGAWPASMEIRSTA